MKRTALFFLVDCISYACLVVIYSLLDIAAGMVSPVNGLQLLEFFAVTTVISLLQVLIDLWMPLESGIGFKTAALQILGVLVPVFGIGGGIFCWFPFQWIEVVIVLAMCIVIYLAVFFLLALKYRADTRELNEAIRKKRNTLRTKEQAHGE